MGDNTYGQLGDGSTKMSFTPEHLLPPGGTFYQLVDSDANGNFALAILGNTPPVPEPATWLGGALTLAAAGLTLHRRRASRPQAA